MTLSYAWGEDIRNHWIVVDGQYVAVTENLEAALRSLRMALNEDPQSKTYLWVDALCINQEDVSERGREIKRMRQIYGDALGGVVHIGVASEDSDLAIQSIRSIAHNMKEGFDCQKWLVDLSTEVSDGKPSPSTPSLVAIINLICRPYWSRMWIIQELAMGQDQSVVCGDSWVELADLRQVLKMLVLNLEPLMMIVTVDLIEANQAAYQAAVALLWYIGKVREIVLLQTDEAPVSYSSIRLPILTLAQYATATDARDKIYGMMALLPSRIVTRIDHNDRNYELSTAQVFMEFSKSIIEVTGDLDVIFASSLKQKSLSELELPTWAADWTLRHDRTTGNDASSDWDFSVEDGYQATIDFTLPSVLDPNMNISRADGKREGKIDFPNDDRLLFCEGFCIGNIDGIGAESSSDFNSLTSTPDYVVQPTSSASPYKSLTEIKQALVRLLLLDPSGKRTKESIILDLPWFGEGADADAQAVSSELSGTWEVFDKMREKGWNTIKLSGGFFNFEQFRRRLGMFRIGGRPFKDYFPQEVADCPGELDFSTLRSISSNVMSRRLVTTHTGHIGLAPATVVPGDAIYILLGSTMPVILRPDQDGRFEVVGECYVDGFMNGEAIERLDSGEFRLQDIVLC